MGEPDDLDALASAFIDDELDPVARAQAAADPEVMRRVATFEAVRSALTVPVWVPAPQRDAAVERALNAAADPDGDRMWRKLLPLGAIAAAAVIIAVFSGRHSGSGSGLVALPADTSVAAAAVAPGQIGAASATAGPGVADLPDLGSLDSVQQLRTALAAPAATGGPATKTVAPVAGATAKSTAPAADAASRTATTQNPNFSGAAATPAPAEASTAPAPPVPGCPEYGEPVALLTWQSTPAIAFRDAAGTVVVTNDSCQQLVRVSDGSTANNP